MKSAYVVDLFCGCGGLSLGFELCQAGSFNTILAIDNNESAIKCFNHNHRRLQPKFKADVGRLVDLTWFNNETEVLIFYLHHFASVMGDQELRGILDSIGLNSFLNSLWHLDELFVRELKSLRQTEDFKASTKKLAKGVSTLALVKRFYRVVEIPSGWSSKVVLPNLIWANDNLSSYESSSSGSNITNIYVDQDIKIALQDLWKRELDHLHNAACSRGRGQHSTVAKKIVTLLHLLESPAGNQLFKIWLSWRAKRDTLRKLFLQSVNIEHLRQIYEMGRQVKVLLGGPPCKGISRIGRAKIASLRDQGVHGWINREYGDDRNLLFMKYVIFLSALRPDIFVFENVRHFTSSLSIDGIEFDAVKSLSDAVDSISTDAFKYQCSSEVLCTHEYGCPQERERFFFAGMKCNTASSGNTFYVSKLLDLPKQETVLPLLAALLGLGNPQIFRFGDSNSCNLSARCLSYASPLQHLGKVAQEFTEWIHTCPKNLLDSTINSVDSHVYRAVREDDAALASLFGLGKRWMDYTVNNGKTLNQLRSFLKKFVNEESTSEEISVLRKAVSGKSIVLQLLMEEMSKNQMDLFGGGGTHHLLNDTYLQKGPDNHGDWFERLDPMTPCKTIVSHMARDTYSFFHPWEPRPLTVREAARIQTFPDWFEFGMLGMCDAYEIVGNAVPPLLSHQIALQLSKILFDQSVSFESV